MGKTSGGNRVCKACDSEVRAGALFCFHCGGSVAPEVVVALKDKKNVSEAWLRENEAAGTNGDKNSQLEKSGVSDFSDKPIPKPVLADEPKLKSAAAMRRKPKNLQPKKVEIIWEEHENAPNLWFILVTIVLTLFAAGVLYLAMRLK